MTSDIRQPDVGGLTSDPFLRSTTFTHLGLRARQKIKLAFWRERRAGRCKAPRRRRCVDIVEERQRRRYAPFAAAPRRAAAPTPSKLLRFAGYDSTGHGSRSKMPNYSCANP